MLRKVQEANQGGDATSELRGLREEVAQEVHGG